MVLVPKCKHVYIQKGIAVAADSKSDCITIAIYSYSYAIGFRICSYSYTFLDIYMLAFRHKNHAVKLTTLFCNNFNSLSI